MGCGAAMLGGERSTPLRVAPKVGRTAKSRVSPWHIPQPDRVAKCVIEGESLTLPLRDNSATQ